MVSREREKVTLFLVVSGLMPTNYFVTVAPVCFYLRGDNCINLNKPLLLSRSSNAWMMVRLVFEYRRSNINKNRWNPMLGFARSRPLRIRSLPFPPLASSSRLHPLSRRPRPFRVPLYTFYHSWCTLDTPCLLLVSKNARFESFSRLEFCKERRLSSVLVIDR